MAQSILHLADSRGKANHGWLKSAHTFSFGSHHDPERIHFGALRVLNDDHIAGGRGFGEHPHDNMEIISIPLSGELKHKDSMGNEAVIRSGEIQVMSAGTGIYHMEFNNHQDIPTELLQIWVFPNKRNVEPRYDQTSISYKENPNVFEQILSPNPKDAGVWIHQNAWFHIGAFEHGKSIRYALKAAGNGVYVFIIKGSVSINGQSLNERDGYGIWDTDSFEITAEKDVEILLMEVPMNI